MTNQIAMVTISRKRQSTTCAYYHGFAMSMFSPSDPRLNTRLRPVFTRVHRIMHSLLYKETRYAGRPCTCSSERDGSGGIITMASSDMPGRFVNTEVVKKTPDRYTNIILFS